jgi:hypothetical protein
MNRNERLREFFRGYSLASLGPEPERLADLYDASFLAAGPKGGAAFKNDESFLAWLRQVNAGNRQSGMTAMEVDEVVETPLSDAYSIATVTWAATFRKTGDEPIRFRISYILRQTDDTLKVAAYISHEDEEEAKKAHGLL